MIIHVDMDAFYASVEQCDNPELAGKPVIVGGTAAHRGVVAAASYEARRYGIRSAMPSVTAERLCPHAIFVPVRMERYAVVSEQIRAIFERYTPLVEPLALDEAFLDVTASTHLFESPDEIARSIKNDIRRELKLSASVGVAPNKFLAKIASDLEKPDGFVHVEEPRQAFLDPLPVTRIWGIGRVAASRLEKIGILTIRDFREANPETLNICLGHSATRLVQLARGEDGRSVTPDTAPVSISRETTFATDAKDLDALESTLLLLTEDVAARLRRKNLFARTVGIKLRFSNFRTITRELTLSDNTDVTQIIWKTARSLLRDALPNGGFRIRLIGIRAGSLAVDSDECRDLFGSKNDEQQKKIDSVVDQLNSRFGKSTVRRGSISSAED